MSPATLRRFRAERLLREEFDGLSDRVIAGARARLRLAGVRLDRSDLEAAYSQAWQGLYAAVLDGEQIVNRCAWLSLVTYRRAIDEHRARARLGNLELDRGEGAPGNGGAVPAGGMRPAREVAAAAAAPQDMAAELDDRRTLRELFEALRGRLSEREQQAATLCYLQGLSRAEAATRMGVSEARMRKLMEGRGDGAPGVAGKVGALLETIRAGAWCEEQGSLMRGFAYGILDPDGERYVLALMHRDECPACRAYVLSLRGLAAVLPPVPSLLHLLLGGGGIAGAAGSLAGSGAGTGAGGLAGGSSSAAGGGVGGALSASGAAGAGAAGGGWWLAGGPLGAKLAVGCALALGIGAGCVALDVPPGAGRSPGHRHSARARRAGAARQGESAFTAVARGVGAPLGGSASKAVRSAAAQAPIAASAQASREFGPEGAAAGGSAGTKAVTARVASAARTASVGSGAGAEAGGSASGTASGTEFSGSSTAARTGSSGAPAAQREFAPG